jgi:hypothetical protein
MANAKVQSLIVRPLRSADLAFPIAGIIAQRSDLAYLGVAIEETKFNEIKGKKDTIYDIISDINNRADNDTGKLIVDSSKIADDLTTSSFFILRNEISKSSLDQMVSQRQNAFLERYKHDADRTKSINELFFPADNSLGKIARMKAESAALDKRYSDLKAAYELKIEDVEDGINRNDAVVINQQSLTKTQPIRIVTPKNQTEIVGTGISQSYTAGKENPGAGIPEPGIQSQQTNPADGKEYKEMYTSQKLSTFYSEFVHPFQDNIISYQRAKVELMTEIMTDELYAVRVAHLEAIWKNELNALDQEVEKFQTSFIHTFLLPPFSGVVTAVYKDVGENVQAGEPVIRMEDNSKILLVGIINYRGVLRLGDVVKIRTGDLFEDGEVLDIPDAKIVSIRGHDSDNDFWDLIFQCDNPKDAAGRYRLPINYHFDRDNIEITI